MPGDCSVSNGYAAIGIQSVRPPGEQLKQQCAHWCDNALEKTDNHWAVNNADHTLPHVPVWPGFLVPGTSADCLEKSASGGKGISTLNVLDIVAMGNTDGD